MKRVISCLVACLLLLSLAGCKKARQCRFYYKTQSISDISIDSEIRSDLSQSDDYLAVLQLYLQGPQSDSLHSPFQPEHRLLSLSVEGKQAILVMNEAFAELHGLELIMACSCISLTCIALTGCEEVSISAENALLDGAKTITMDRTQLLLLDQSSSDSP